MPALAMATVLGDAASWRGSMATSGGKRRSASYGSNSQTSAPAGIDLVLGGIGVIVQRSYWVNDC